MKSAKKYEQVAGRVRELVDSGIIKAGERIPSVRAMSSQMSLSPMTVLEGYRRLEDLGFIESRPQSGYFVRPPHLRRPGPWVKLPDARPEKIAVKTAAVKIPDYVERIFSLAARRDLIPLGAGLPDPRLLPSEELSIRLARVARTDPNEINRYCLGQGHPVLLDCLSRWMIEAGCITSPDEMVVTSGATQAMLLALRAVTRPGDAVAVESPGYYGFYSILQFLNLKAVEIPCSPSHGFQVDALARYLETGRPLAAVLLSASISNPTGAMMPDEEKIRLLRLCRRYDLPVIEDDTYGEIHFQAERPRPLKAFSPDRAVYIGNCSKILSPGYRIAWLAGGRHHKDIMSCHHMAVLAAPVAPQLAVASFLTDGGLSRHVRALNRKYADNIRLFQAEVARWFPSGTRAANPGGGQFLWLELPSGLDAGDLVEGSIANGFSIAPGILFSARQNYRGYLRLNCALEWTPEVQNALRILGGLAADLKEKA